MLGSTVTMLHPDLPIDPLTLTHPFYSQSEIEYGTLTDDMIWGGVVSVLSHSHS